MRFTQTLYYIFPALLVDTIVTAKPLPSDMHLPSWDLIERRSDDVAGSAMGSAAGIDGQPTQTQNTTSPQVVLAAQRMEPQQTPQDSLPCPATCTTTKLTVGT